MIDEITPLANVRSKVTRLKESKKEFENNWKNNPDYLKIVEDLKESEFFEKKLIEEYEIKYKSLAIVDEKGKILNPNPHPAITLKRFSVFTLKYDPKKVFNWCLHNLTTVLDLNTKEFEKQAKTGKLPNEVVEILEDKETRVQFAMDLSEYEYECVNLEKKEENNE